MQDRAIVSVQWISLEPFHVLDIMCLLLIPWPAITHIPLLVMRVRANHLEWLTTLISQQPMSNSRGNDDQVTTLDGGLKPLRILLSSKAKMCTTCNYPQDLMCGGMKVGFTIHGICPLGDDFTNVLKAAGELCGCGVKCPVVYDDGLRLDGSVGHTLPFRNLAISHLDIRWQVESHGCVNNLSHALRLEGDQNIGDDVI